MRHHLPPAHTSPRRTQLLAFVPVLTFLLVSSSVATAQSGDSQKTTAESTEQKVERLTAAVTRAQTQMEAYQKELVELRGELTALRKEIAGAGATAPGATPPMAAQPADASIAEPSGAAPPSLGEIQERQALQESQIATHEVSKVETQSKYPLKVTGLILFNGFVNTRQVDVSASPAYAGPGSGSTGLSIRQTVLGFDARGPHLLGATSYADLRVDFFANGVQSNYAASGLLRLRTAHAGLDWPNTEAFVELDRSILEPNEPSSLVAVAQPELAWAGNLWNWNPQVGLTHRFPFSNSSRIQAQAALIDTFDPQPPGVTSTLPVTQTERSRWPGTEARIAFQRSANFAGSEKGLEIGAGGYFSPHSTDEGNRFDAWAGALDLSVPLAQHLELTANAYRGQALAGLGAGGYVNYFNVYEGGEVYPRALDDVGGWAQLKARAGRRVEFNEGFGTDNPFAKEIRVANSSAESSSQALLYPGLSRNRAFFSNVIYSPSAYLLFSLEYKRLWTNLAAGPTDSSDSIGVGAGYRF